MFSEPNLRILYALILLGTILALVRHGPALSARYATWRERRAHMRWFADEFLPDLMATAKKTGNAAVAARVLQSTPVVEVKSSAGGQATSAAAVQELEEVMSRLPQSERERLSMFVKSRT